MNLGDDDFLSHCLNIMNIDTVVLDNVINKPELGIY